MNILLVDDDAVDRELFAEALLSVNNECNVTEAENGEDALKRLITNENNPDLIILDLNMPVKDGRETLQEIRNHPRLKHLPVCILSTSNSQFDVISAYENGANLFLVKPLEFNLLIEMLSNLLNLFKKFVSVPRRTIS